MSMYSKRIWLNDDDSASTGSVVAYHGKANWDKDRDAKATFLEVSDCHCKARLHKTHGDTMESFIAKLRALSSVASEFAAFLESDSA